MYLWITYISPGAEKSPLDRWLQASGPARRELQREEDAGGDREGDQGAGGGAPEAAAGEPRIRYSLSTLF